jgi:methionyl-tRNA formyltransferase
LKTLKVVFAGTPEFAKAHLQKLYNSGYNIEAVYTQPDRPAGRGRKQQQSAVKQYAQQQQLAIYQPKSLKDPQTIADINKLNPDILIVVAYGMILPQQFLDIPKLGCINVHASLLPRWRGAAPIQRAIEAGDATTGITIMQMDAGLDTGDMLLQESCEIDATDTSVTLENKLATIGSKLLCEVLLGIKNNSIVRQPQQNSLATYAHKINKAEARIDCNLSALVLSRKLRAFMPRMGLNFMLDNHNIKICEAEEVNIDHNHDNGTIIKVDKTGIDIACNQSILRVTALQLPGKRQLAIQDILNGNKDLFIVGKKLITSPSAII